MPREPDWFRLGYRMASGEKKSSMNLPEDFFQEQTNKILRDDFNVQKFSFDYAVAWLETEQWKQEVGQKIRKFIKRYRDEDVKVDEFMEKAMQWSDGYTGCLLDNFELFWKAIPVEQRCNFSEEILTKLVEQALYS